MAEPGGLRATDALLEKAQTGDRRALNAFFGRELPSLRRWAQQRVPRWLHRRADPDDIVQAAAIKTLRRLCHLDPQRATVRPYMRQAVLNLIRDEIRAAGRAPDGLELQEDDAAMEASPTDVLFARDTLKAYRSALRRLSPSSRRCIVARVERGLTYEQIAKELEKPSKGAARIAVTRALQALSAEMRGPRVSGSRNGRPARHTSAPGPHTMTAAKTPRSPSRAATEASRGSRPGRRDTPASGRR